MKHLLTWCLILFGALWSDRLLAQGFGQRPSPGMGQEPHKETPEGPAEAVPEDKEGEPELPPLPAWPGQESKRLELFQMNGYFRFRWNMHHNLNLGQFDVGGLKAPFYYPISETTDASGTPVSSLACANRRDKPVPGGGDRDLSEDDCPAKTLGGADIRLRLEPTIIVSEKVQIHTQLDIFDNLALGSTPNVQTADVPFAAFSEGQAPPVAGYNSSTPAVLVKRAWANVGTPLGELRFGRMGVHWGLGILHNDGSCWNCDGGVNADRIMFTSILSGYTLGMGYDFSSSGPNSFGVQRTLGYLSGQPVDLEKLDDVHQWFWVLGRIDQEEVIKDKVLRDELVINYGLYLLWRWQDYDYSSEPGLGSSESDYATAMLERHVWTLTPDLWFKLLWKSLYIEFEGVFRGGNIEDVANSDTEDSMKVLQFGWALRSRYGFLRDTLRVGLDLGMASGDQAEPTNADIDRRRFYMLKDPRNDNDRSLREFRFNYDYQVDLILFRELMSSVSNAVYFKPWISYDVVDSFGGRLDLIYSLAHDPISFPGNSRNIGLELDLSFFYRNVEDGFYAGFQYGVLFPFAALERPEAIFGSTYATDADIAHTLQGNLIVKF